MQDPREEEEVPMKITDQQRKWWHHEFEDFEFRGDLVTCEIASDGPLPFEGDVPTPGLVLEITRIGFAGDPLGTCETYPDKKPHRQTSCCRNWKQTSVDDGPVLEGEAADKHYTEEQKQELIKLLEQKLADDWVDYQERHDSDP